MLKDISIRNACYDDAREILGIYAYYIKNTAITFECTVPQLEEFMGRIAEISSTYPYLVAICQDRIVGYAYAHAFYGREAYRWSVETSIYLDRSFRRNGVGTVLYRALEDRLKEEGYRNMYACIASPLGDDPFLDEGSIGFHREMGFSQCGHFRQCGFKFGRWYDVVWMEKMIGEHKMETR